MRGEGSCQREETSFYKGKKRAQLELELELELIQSNMTQKPVLRGEVDALALRV